jgi:hypothetical protein
MLGFFNMQLCERGFTIQYNIKKNLNSKFQKYILMLGEQS